MKLHNIVASSLDEEAQKLRHLGKALIKPASTTQPVLEAKTTMLSDEDSSPEMDAAIHTLTQDQKHLHKKLAHHD